MQRRTFLHRAALSGAALSLTPFQTLLAERWFPTGGQFTTLRNNVGYYTERGGTIGWLLSPGATAVVDTQFQEQSQNLLSGLRERQDLPKLDLLINTHHHGDHTSGNPVFKDILQQHVAHQNAYQNQERVARENDKLAEVLLPATTYERDWSTQLDGEKVRLRYFGPAHTNGDSVIHFENANVAHLGDLIFNRRFPYIDPKAGGTFRGWIKVLRKIRRTYDKDTIFIFGHAAPSYPVTGSLHDLKAKETYIRRLLDYVKAAKRRGDSLEQLQTNTTVIPGAEAWRYGERLRNINLAVAWEEV